MEQDILDPLQISKVAHASRLASLLRQALNDTDRQFLSMQELSAAEFRQWRNARKEIYFSTVASLGEAVHSKIDAYSAAHLSAGPDWGHIRNTFRMRTLSWFYLNELRLFGFAYFLGCTRIVPATRQGIDGLMEFVQASRVTSQ